MLSIFKGRNGGEVNQKRDRQRTSRSLTNVFTVTHCASEFKRIAALSRLHFSGRYKRSY